jgi:hypothetical protein
VPVLSGPGATSAGDWEHVFSFHEQHRWFYRTARAVEAIATADELDRLSDPDGTVTQ